jgi:branched-chain amino acid transport system ATP-binding protein
MLEVRSISCRYGSIVALRNATLTVSKGEFVAIIGANGAGKSTLLRAISGLTPPHAGEILFDGTRIDQASTGDIVHCGIAHCPEERKIWPQLSVNEHLRLGAYGRRNAVDIRADIERIYETFPPIAERRQQLCGTLSGGEQQMVAIGRALMSRPRWLMETVSAIHRQGTAILMVEQSAVLALRRAQRAYLLENGSIVKSGPGQDLLQDPDVKRAYLGGGLAGTRRARRA